MMKCDFCKKEGDWKMVLRNPEIVKKDGSDVVLCNECMNHYAKEGLRLQEKEDWKRMVSQVIEKLRKVHYDGQDNPNPDGAMHTGAYIALGDLLLELKRMYETNKD